jgi:DNA-binding NarL/FixJ family response regulator
MPISVFIYDDSTERRESLRALIALDDGLRFVGEAADCRQVLAEMEAMLPDVVLMDINMPEVDGLQGLRLIKTHFPAIKVLIQTAYDDDDKVFTSIRHGASGYILKNERPQRILQAIEEVYQGGAVMNPGVAQKVLNYFQPAASKSPLSPREQEVLALLAEGLSYKMAAAKLGLSYTTVNTHVKRIYEKLHISSLGEALAYYYKRLH